jgi:CHAD domain-containing protein
MNELKENDLSVETPGAVEADAADPRSIHVPVDWKRVRRLALRQLNRLISLEPKVLRGDDADAIHDMRVATRRLQQLLDLMFPKPCPREVLRLRRRIRRIRRGLGDVRNCDVLLHHVGQALGRKGAARRDAWTALQDYLLESRQKNFEKARRKVTRQDLPVLSVRLRKCLDEEWLAGTSEHPSHPGAFEKIPVTVPFASRIVATLGEVWMAFEDQIALSQRDSSASTIHAARIATKRLRYLIEVLQQFEIEGSREALVWLRRLQQNLGDWHDLEILEDSMIKMLARPQFLREQIALAMNMEKLILRNRALKKKHAEKYYRIVQPSEDLNRLKDWVVYLLESPSDAFAGD